MTNDDLNGDLAGNHDADPKSTATAIDANVGPSRHHGRLACSATPDPLSVGIVFQPEYFSAIYLKFEKFGSRVKMIARHGYAEISPSWTPDEIQAAAETELAEAKSSNSGNWRRKNEKAKREWRREENLEDFDFDSQNLIFILLDHHEDEFRFDDRKDTLSKKQANLVRFSHYAGQADSTDIDYTEVEPNNAFMNARLIDVIDTGTFDGQKLLCIENWYTDEFGKTVTGKPRLRYSMNLHLLATTEGGAVLPLIIDPDTGNGMGNNP